MEHDQAYSAKSLIRLIESNPLNLPAYCVLARVYESTGEFRNAELTLRRATEINPLHHETWARLGVLYSNLGAWSSAADAFEQACALDSLHPACWVGYGMALIATQDIQGAVEVRNTLLEKFPDRSETHLIDGHINKIRGQAGKAADSYRRALQIDPYQTDAMLNLVDLSLPEPSDPLTRNLEKLRQDPARSHRQSANVCFALARIYEAADQVDRAFSLFQEANVAAGAMMQRLGNAYDPKKFADEAKKIIDVFDPDVFAARLEPPEIDVKMIFIVGLPRSGTTLVERILSSHSGVSTGGELPFMQDCISKLWIGRQSVEAHGPINLEDKEERLLLLGLREEYLDRLFERELDSEYVIDKLPANFVALGLIRLLFPDAVIVHCTRDPIATCWSLYSAHFGTHLSYYTSFEHLVHYFTTYSRLMTHWEKTLSSDIVNVNYETLVQDEEREIRELVRRCGLPWEESCLHFYDNEQPIYTASMQQARQRIYTTSVSRWRKFEKHLTPLIEGLQDIAGGS